MCWRMPLAVIACAAVSASAVLAAVPVFLSPGAAHAAAVNAASARRVLDFTNALEGRRLRLAVLLPGAVHRIGKNEPAAPEVGKRARIGARGLRQIRKIEDVVAEPGHHRQRCYPGRRRSVLDALKARILVARAGRLAQDDVG